MSKNSKIYSKEQIIKQKTCMLADNFCWEIFRSENDRSFSVLFIVIVIDLEIIFLLGTCIYTFVVLHPES